MYFQVSYSPLLFLAPPSHQHSCIKYASYTGVPFIHFVFLSWPYRYRGVQLILSKSWARLSYPLLSLLSLFSLSLRDDTKWPTGVAVSLNPNTISQSWPYLFILWHNSTYKKSEFCSNVFCFLLTRAMFCLTLMDKHLKLIQLSYVLDTL